MKIIKPTITIVGLALTIITSGCAKDPEIPDSSGPILTISPINQNVTIPAGTTTFNVSSNSSWTVYSDQPWCTVNEMGIDNGTIKANYAQNTLPNDRIANISVTVSGLEPVFVTVTQIGARFLFLGKWSVIETWTKLTYEVNITADPGSNDGVFISNFANTGSSGIPAGATIAGTSIVLDANQVIGDGLIINGSGNLSGTKINWNYTLDDGADIIHAIATYTKQ